MPTIVVPLKDIVTDVDNPIDLASLPEAEAILRLKDIYGFLSSAVDVSIDNGVATITLTEEQGHKANQALRDIERASRLAARGRIEPAIALYRDALTVLPEHTVARRELAMALMETGDTSAAKQHLIRVMQLAPSDAWAYLIMGNLYFHAEKDYGSAERYYVTAIDLAPDDPYVLTSYAGLLATRKQYDEARELFERAMAQGTDYPNPYYGLALMHANRDELDAAKETLEELFLQVRSEDPRRDQVYSEAQKLYRDTRRRLASEQSEENLARMHAVLEDYEGDSGFGIRLEEDELLPTTAKVELAWRHNRPYHLIKYRRSKPATLPYLLAHEFEHVLMDDEARASGRNKSVFTAAKHRRAADRAIEKDVRRIRKRRGLDDNSLDQYLNQVIEGLVNQVYNAPLDMVIESRIHDKYPFLQDSQFTGMSDENEQNLRPVRDDAIRNITPTVIYKANLAMNAAGAVFFDALFGNVTDYASEYQRSGMLSTGQRLYDLWQECMRAFEPGDEYDLVDAFAEELKLQDWYGWQADDVGSQTQAGERRPVENDKGGQTNPALLAEPALQMAATMYMLGALKRFANMDMTDVQQVAGEIALVGMDGLDYSSSDRKYTLRFLPGEEFSGLQLMCLMHVGFKQIDPSLDTGIPLDDAYRSALTLYEQGN